MNEPTISNPYNRKIKAAVSTQIPNTGHLMRFSTHPMLVPDYFPVSVTKCFLAKSSLKQVILEEVDNQRWNEKNNRKGGTTGEIVVSRYLKVGLHG